MKQDESKKNGRKGKQFTVIRSFGGNLTASEYVERLASSYKSKEYLRK